MNARTKKSQAYSETEMQRLPELPSALKVGRVVRVMARSGNLRPDLYGMEGETERWRTRTREERRE